MTNSKLGAAAVQTSNVGDAQITKAKLSSSAVDSTVMDMTATYDFSSGTLQSATPSNSNDVANKSYVDSVASGLYVREPAVAAAGSNIDLSDLPASIDGISMSNGDRFLCLNQSPASENGVYSYSSAGGSASRTSDMDEADDFPGAFLWVKQGNTYEDQGFVCTNDSVTLGSTSISFVRFSGTGMISVSGGLQKNGDDLSIADSGVSSAKIASGAVVSAKIGTGAVLTAAVGDAQITQANCQVIL